MRLLLAAEYTGIVRCAARTVNPEGCGKIDP